MQPTNHSERKKKFSRFGVYYFLSVAAICVLVFAFADGWNNREQLQGTDGSSASRSAEMAFSADSLLHRQLSALETTDNLYSAAHAAGKSREAMRAADSLRKVLPAVEQNFQFTLDSVSRVSRLGDNPSLKRTVDYFAAALELRARRISLPRSGQPMSAFVPAPALVPASAAATMSVDDLMKINPGLKGEMLKKDIRIADMEAALAEMKKYVAAKNALPANKLLAANRQLQMDYETLEKNNKTLTETNNRLRNAATQTTASPATPDAAETEAVKSARNRAVKMEQQLQEMNADLSFSTVDCNLSRADVNQIIYNGKQRKALLQQALDILTTLKKSSDEEVQKRAAQKISQLNRIAMTVRD